MRGADILDRAELYPSLEAASHGVDLLVGTSGHFTPEKPQWIDCRGFSLEILPRYLPRRVGIAFGSEDNGLTREEAALCQWLIEIPSGSDYGVLNLAQAVGILAYELHMAMREASPRPGLHQAGVNHVTGLMQEIEEILQALDYPLKVPRARVMKRLNKLAARAELEVEDVNLLRGLLRHLRQRLP